MISDNVFCASTAGGTKANGMTPWSAAEDQQLGELIEEFGTGGWEKEPSQCALPFLLLLSLAFQCLKAVAVLIRWEKKSSSFSTSRSANSLRHRWKLLHPDYYTGVSKSAQMARSRLLHPDNYTTAKMGTGRSGPWTESEDRRLKEMVAAEGLGEWEAKAVHFPGRCETHRLETCDSCNRVHRAIRASNCQVSCNQARSLRIQESLHALHV